jgi:hypothetical protein
MENLDEGKNHGRSAHMRGPKARLGALAAGGPIETDACRNSAKVQQVNHICSFPGIPARLIGS